MRSACAPSAKVTARVRRLVDDVHDGDLLEASAHAGVPYAVMRNVHSGRRAEPATLRTLADRYGLPLAWFLDGPADDGTVPVAGWAGVLPSEDLSGCGRRVTIPYGAWPLIRVLVRLEQRLRDCPADPARPIIGDATDPRVIRARLLTFLFQPLSAAEAAGSAAAMSGPVADGSSVAVLRDLGRFWERALASLMDGRGAPVFGGAA